MGSDVARQSVQVHSYHTGVLSFVTPGKQSCDDTCEYVTAASCCHSGIACGVEDDVTIGKTEGRVMTLEDDVAIDMFCEVTRLGESFVTVVAVALESFEFLGMRREDDTLRQLLHPCPVVGQDVYRVSIGNDRTLCTSQLCYECHSRLFTGAKTGTDA